MNEGGKRMRRERKGWEDGVDQKRIVKEEEEGIGRRKGRREESRR